MLSKQSRLRNKIESLKTGENIDHDNLKELTEIVEAAMKDTVDEIRANHNEHASSKSTEEYQYKKDKLKAITTVSGWAILAILISVFTITKCGYEIKEDKDGRTIRVDKWTGNISILEGNTLITPETEEQEKARQQESQKKEKDEIAVLSDEYIWPTQDIPKTPSVKIHLSTTWMDGDLCYKLRLQPLTQKFLQLRETYGSSDSLTLNFLDKHGFTLLKTDGISILNLTPEVDSKGMIDALNYEGHVPCHDATGIYRTADSKAKYLDIANWTFSYSIHDYSSLDIPPPPPSTVNQ